MYPQVYSAKPGNVNNFGFHTLPKLFSESQVYTIVAQDAVEVQDIQNAPAISIGCFSESSG